MSLTKTEKEAHRSNRHKPVLISARLELVVSIFIISSNSGRQSNVGEPEADTIHTSTAGILQLIIIIGGPRRHYGLRSKFDLFYL